MSQKSWNTSLLYALLGFNFLANPLTPTLSPKGRGRIELDSLKVIKECEPSFTFSRLNPLYFLGF